MAPVALQPRVVPHEEEEPQRCEQPRHHKRRHCDGRRGFVRAIRRPAHEEMIRIQDLNGRSVCWPQDCCDALATVKHGGFFSAQFSRNAVEQRCSISSRRRKTD